MAGVKRVTVLVADDHPMFRTSLVRLVGRDPRIELVGEAPDGLVALELIRALRPQVALVDLNMPGLDGVGVLDAIVAERLPTRVMLLSGSLDDADVYRGLEQGAAAVLLKTLDASEVVDAIVAVARGGTVLAPELQSVVASQIRLRASGDTIRLTDREREILVHIAQGLTNPEIAQRLYLSPSTVKSHVERLFSKLGVSDRSAAVAAGMRQGLIG